MKNNLKKIKKKNKKLNMTFFSPELNRVLTAIYLAYLSKKKVILYFDISVIQDPIIKKKYELLLHDIFKIFPNIIFITTYIPGFISNAKNEHFLTKVQDFVIFVFLNFTFENTQHRILIGEVKRYLYEVVIITKDNRELNFDKIAPYTYINLNLNLQDQFDFFYIVLYRFMFKIHKIPKSRFLPVNASIDFEQLSLISVLYSLKILRNKKILNYLKNKLKIKSINNLDNFIDLVINQNKIQKWFYNKYFKQEILNLIKKYYNLIKQKIFLLSKKKFGFGIYINEITEKLLKRNDFIKIS